VIVVLFKNSEELFEALGWPDAPVEMVNSPHSFEREIGDVWGVQVGVAEVTNPKENVWKREELTNEK